MIVGTRSRSVSGWGRPTSRIAAVALAVSFGSAFGCTGDPESVATSSSELLLFDGGRDTGIDDVHTAALQLESCVGTVIAPRVMITAAHCLGSGRQADYVTSCIVHPNAIPGRTITECPGHFSDSDVRTTNDIGVLILAARVGADIPSPTPPACTRFRVDIPQVAPQRLSLAGPVTGSVWAPGAWIGRRATEVGSNRCGGHERLFASGQISQASSFLTLSFDQFGQLAQSGDSGGPLLFMDSVTRVESLIGVHHGGAGSSLPYCQQSGVEFPEFAATGYPGTRDGTGRVVRANDTFLLAFADPAHTGNVDALLGSAEADTSCCTPGSRDFSCYDADDPDCDGVRSHGNGLDNCPNDYNPDQLNVDGDQRGDVCDNCPCVQNPNQENCNEDVERLAATHSPPTLGVDVIGDACDPVHCAAARAISEPVNALLFGTNTTIDVTPRWSGEHRLNFVTGETRGLGRFGERFCACDGATQSVASRKRCAAAQRFGGANCFQSEIEAGRLRSVLFASPDEPRVPATMWHRIRQYSDLEGECVGCSPRATCGDAVCDVGEDCGSCRSDCGLCVAPDTTFALRFALPFGGGTPGGPSEVLFRWAQRADAADFWDTGFPLPAITGVLWTFVPTFTADDGGAVADTEMRSNYISGYFSEGTPFRAYFNSIYPDLPWSPLTGEMCPACGGAFPRSRLVSQGSAIAARLVAGDIELTSRVAPIATASLLDRSFRWLAPVEPAPQVEPDFPTLVALRGDATDIASIVVAEGSVLRDVREKAIPQGLNAGIDPPARVGFGTVLSAAAATRGVYVVGGRNSDGSLPFEIHRFDLAAGLWHTYPLLGDPLPDRVLSTTLRPEDQSIYLLDRVDGNGRSGNAHVRMVRVGATSGLVALIQVFNGHPDDAWNVAATWDGRLAVVRSDRVSRHWHAELATVDRGVYSVVGRAEGRGFVLGDIATDDLGVSMLVDDGRTVQTIGVRYSDLEGRPGEDLSGDAHPPR